ncbi:hypothetical protein CCACVL1_29648 [Corchorus capsularis]|uniref:Protein FLX-like 3 n=1 Tax=Corchorus capsularis TaxID=210143 RepID=A0A1R3G0W8_COCAP|nr:hypothetical protein CCACVL1_29648 [Corchorus capsularis]
MMGRNRTPHHPQSFHHGPLSAFNQEPGPMPYDPAALEELVEMQHMEMQRIISDNRVVIDSNTHLQRELTAAKDEIFRLNQVTCKLQTENEIQTRELIDGEMKLQAEIQASDLLRAEVVQSRIEIQQLNALRLELTTQLQGLTKEVNHLEAENQQLIDMMAPIEGMHKELIDARRAINYEKRLNEQQAEEKKAMKEKLISMACELEKLRAEKMNTESRARLLGGYESRNGSPEMGYPAGDYESRNGSPEMRYPASEGYHGDWKPYSNNGPWR